MKRTFFIVSVIFSLVIVSYADPLSDKEMVEKASMDYIEGFYEGNTKKLEDSLIPDMQKSGFWRKKGAEGYESAGRMSFKQALDFAKNVKEKKQFPKADAPKKVEVIEVLDKIAITKVTAWWGIDYMLLAKNDGKWMIRQILWEGPIKTATPSKTDKAGAMKAGMGYIEGFYEGDVEKLKSSLKPEMYKFGYGYNRKEGKFRNGNRMTYERALDYAAKVKENKLFPKEGAPKKVEVLDVMNQTAAIKVTAWWGVDYMLLSKDGDKWMIEQVLWAGLPPKK